MCKILAKFGKKFAELIFAKFGKISKFFGKISQIFDEILAIFKRKNVILEQCKGAYCVDLGESFQMRNYSIAKIGFDATESEPCKVCPISGWCSFEQPGAA